MRQVIAWARRLRLLRMRSRFSLDTFRGAKSITLVLYSRGGDTLAAWGIANLIRQFCDEFHVVVPFHAHSAATLICLGANSITMTKQATLGPIDPSVNTPYNPQVGGQTVPVRVEAVAGYVDLAKTMLGLTSDESLRHVALKLAENSGLLQVAHPRDWIVIVEGQPYQVPPSKLLVMEAIGAANPSGTGQGVFLEIDGVKQVAACADYLLSNGGGIEYAAFGGNGTTIKDLPIGLKANTNSQVVVGGGGFGRAWGYLVDA
jgi:hypothetical protein